MVDNLSPSVIRKENGVAALIFMEEKNWRCARICPPAAFLISYRIHAILDGHEYESDSWHDSLARQSILGEFDSSGIASLRVSNLLLYTRIYAAMRVV